MLKNGNFSAGWTDLSPVGFLVNQQPRDWQLHWVEPGQPLFGAGDLAGGVPECVHKLSDQLPPEEQLGGSNALILDGSATYKIFHAGSPFGAELKQTITGLNPGATGTLTVPVLAVLHNETDPFGAESGAWANGQGQWANGGQMGNRRWFRHVVDFTVPENGTAEVIIRVKSKWPRPKDFFIDGVTLTVTGGQEPEPPQPTDNVRVQVPAGYKVVVTTCHSEGVVVISVPEGLGVEVSA